MLSLSQQHGCLPYMIVLVAALSVREVFVTAGEKEEESDVLKEEDRMNKLHRSWVGKVRSVYMF